MRKGANEYLITKPPFWALLRFAIPMMLSSLLQQLYSLADSVLVGRFVSQNALAAIGACNGLTAVFIMVALGAGIGASVPVAAKFGERRYGPMRQAFFTALTMFVATGTVLALLGLVMGRTFLIWLHAPAEVLDMSTTYLRIYFVGFPFLFLYNVMANMFNALGDSKTPLYLLIFSTMLNVVLDILFISAFGWGVAGAAIATVIAQGGSAVLSLVLFLRRLSGYPKGEHRYFSVADMKEITRIAIPSIVQQSTISIGILLVQSVVNSFGAEALAGYSAASVVNSLVVCPVVGMSGAMTPYTAQNIGAGKPERIPLGLKAGYQIIGVYAAIIAVTMQFFSTPFAAVFLGEKGTQIAYDTATGYLQFIGWFYLFIGLKQTTDGVLRGLGYMKMFMIANLVNLSIRVLVAMIFAPIYGIGFVWYAVPLGWFANFVISFSEYRRRKPEFLYRDHTAA